MARELETYTIDDIYALPDGERAELIDGQIYYMAPQNTKHQRLVHFFEIVSPGSESVDYFAKLFKYRTAGVSEYWIVDSVKQRVTVYFFEKVNGK